MYIYLHNRYTKWSCNTINAAAVLKSKSKYRRFDVLSIYGKLRKREMTFAQNVKHHFFVYRQYTHLSYFDFDLNTFVYSYGVIVIMYVIMYDITQYNMT